MTIKYIGRPEPGQDCSQFYAVIGIDKDGNEGICGLEGKNVAIVPLVFSQWDLWKNAASGIAHQIAEDNPDMRIELRKYTDYEVVEELSA